MRSAHLTVRIDDVEPRTAFDRIRDFARYPDLVDVVRAVRVHPVTDQEETSDWEVYFRNGILRWSETDEMDPVALTIAFRQLDGDFAEFSGLWRVRADDEHAGCVVDFAAEFDFGIPSLAGILDPVAERVLKETLARVVLALFDRAVVVGDAVLAGAVTGAPGPARAVPTSAVAQGVR